MPFYMFWFFAVDNEMQIGYKTYYNYFYLLFLTKLFRLKKSVQIFSPKYFKDIIGKSFTASRMEKIRKVENKDGGYFDPYKDYNEILE